MDREGERRGWGIVDMRSQYTKGKDASVFTASLLMLIACCSIGALLALALLLALPSTLS